MVTITEFLYLKLYILFLTSTSVIIHASFHNTLVNPWAVGQACTVLLPPCSVNSAYKLSYRHGFCLDMGFEIYSSINLIEIPIY